MATGEEGGNQSQAIMAIVLVARQEGILDAEAPKKPAKPRRPQQLRWALPGEIVYGTALDTLPAVEVVEGNRDAAPAYAPARTARLVGQGDHFFSVSVAGNDEFEPAELRLPLRVRGAPLHVKAPSLMMEAGTPIARFTPEITGAAVAGDRFHVEFDCAAPPNPPACMSGHPISPRVVFDQGLAANYSITLERGLLKVRPSERDLMTAFSGFRERIKKLPPDRQQELDEQIVKIGTARSKEKLDELAERQHELESDIDRLEYFEVTDVTIAPHPDRITAFGKEVVRITATVLPDNATQPALAWSVDRPELATIAPDGTLTRTGADGGQLRVTATSQCRAGIIKSTVLTVEPRPQAVEILGPFNFFLDDPAQLKARVLPEEADQRVVWKVVPTGWKRNAALTADGLLTVHAPTASGGSASGQLWVRAVSVLDPEVEDKDNVFFGGKKTNSVAVKPRMTVVELGARVTLTAQVGPGEANQAVVWELDDDTIAHLENIADLSVDVVMDKGGSVSVRAKATDGTDVEGEAQISVKVHLEAFDLICPSSEIGLVDTLRLTPVFTPKEAACRVEWSFAKGKGLVAGKLEKGVLHPTEKGLIRLTAAVPETDFSKTVDIQVTADENMTVDANQWPQIMPLVQKYITLLNVHDVQVFADKADRWLRDLSDAITRTGATRTLKALQDELIALRNLQYRIPHWQWLEHAGFASGGNCYIRSNGTMNHQGTAYRVHMTMFPTDASIEVGAKDKYQALENKIYRVNVTGFKSMHATLYVRPVGTDDQCKVYCSEEDWTAPYQVRNYVGGNDAYDALKGALKTWMTTEQAAANRALKQVFDDAHKPDDKKIA